MKKAVLVIDMPKTCYKCPLCYEQELCICVGDTKPIDVNPAKGKPEWCPLRPLPKKRNHGVFRVKDTGDVIKVGSNPVALGWNECLRAIGGE